MLLCHPSINNIGVVVPDVPIAGLGGYVWLYIVHELLCSVVIGSLEELLICLERTVPCQMPSLKDCICALWKTKFMNLDALKLYNRKI